MCEPRCVEGFLCSRQVLFNATCSIRVVGAVPTDPETKLRPGGRGLEEFGGGPLTLGGGARHPPTPPPAAGICNVMCVSKGHDGEGSEIRGAWQVLNKNRLSECLRFMDGETASELLGDVPKRDADPQGQAGPGTLRDEWGLTEEMQGWRRSQEGSRGSFLQTDCKGRAQGVTARLDGI